MHLKAKVSWTGGKEKAMQYATNCDLNQEGRLRTAELDNFLDRPGHCVSHRRRTAGRDAEPLTSHVSPRRLMWGFQASLGRFWADVSRRALLELHVSYFKLGLPVLLGNAPM